MRPLTIAITICTLLIANLNPALSQKSQGQDEEIVRVQTTLVTVPVSVTDHHGKYVANLRKEDFRVYEDNVEQTVAFFSPVNAPFTVAFLIDASPSTGFVFGEIVDAANLFINLMKPDDRLRMVFFDGQMHEIVKLTRVRDLRPLTANYTPACCGTRLYDAVNVMLNRKLKDMSGRKAIILFTDGVDTASRKTYEDNLRRAEEMDVLIYPVQYDTLVRRSSAEEYQTAPRGMKPEDYERGGVYLQELARKTGARLYRGEHLQDLAKAFVSIAQELGQQYSVGYYPRVTVKPGQRREVKVNVSVPDLVVHARESYVSTR